MGLDLHTVDVIKGSTPTAFADKLLAALLDGVAFAASAASVTSVGGITAGSGYLAPVALAFTGGTGSGAAALPIMKGLTVSQIVGGGQGYAASDTITLPGGIVLTVGTVSGGVITAATVTTPGSVTNPQDGPTPQVSTSGSGTGASFILTYGLLGVQMLNSGNYSVVPTGITLTGKGGVGSAAAGTPALGGAGNAIFVSPPSLPDLPATYIVQATPTVPAFVSAPYQGPFGFTIALTPILAAATLAAGSVDILVIG